MKQHFLFILTSVAVLAFPQASTAQVAPALGAASSFALFTAVGAVNNSGPTIINGDIGTNAGAFNGFPLGVVVNGSIHVADALATQAATDVQTAYGYMSTIPCVTPLGVYGGTPAVTLIPGSYCVGGASTLAGTLILDGGGDPNAKFFLRVSGALTTAANSLVITQNGATPANVYWQIGGLVTLGQNSVMRGTLLVDGAINMIQGATLIGRGLSREGAITIDTNSASLPNAAVVPVVTGTFWLGNPLGTGTTNWFTPGNWSNGVPTSTVDATVPTNTAPYPVIASGNAQANGLTIGTGASLTMNGGTLDVKATLNNSGTISATAGTASLSGTTTQLVGGSGSTQLWSLNIANSAGALQTGAVSIHGVLAPSSGNLNTNGRTLTLLSDAAGTALVNNTGAGIVNGTATVQRYIASANSGLGYRHYSAPVSGSTVGDLTTVGFAPEISQGTVYNTSATPGTTTPFPTVFAYDQSRLATVTNNYSAFDKGFFVPASLASPLAVGQGYVVNISASQVVDFVGSLTNGPQTLSLSRNAAASPNTADAGWQLVGNPYPSPLDYSLVAPADRTGLDGAIYVYASSGPYVGGYRAYINGIGGNPVLPVAQGFFARVSTGQTTGTLTFRNSQRLTTPNSTTFQRTTAADTRPLVQLQLQGSATTLADETFVYFEQGATAGFDASYDAYKLPNSTGLSLSSLAANDELSINGLAPLTTAATVPLNVVVPAIGTYTLSAASLVNFGTGTQVLLLDTQTGARIDLSRQPSYTFSAASTSLPGRFSLSFSLSSPLASNTARLTELVQLFPNPTHGSFTLLLPAELGSKPVTVAVLNQLGQVVAQRTVAMTAAGATATFDVSGLAQGIYSLRLTSAQGQLVKRVVVAK